MAKRQGRQSGRGQLNNKRTFGPSGRVFTRPDRETTAPDSLIQRIGAEGTDIDAASLKATMVEDAADTKD